MTLVDEKKGRGVGSQRPHLQPENTHIHEDILKFSKEVNSCSSHLWVLIFLMVIGSFAVRIAALAHWHTGAIESEGAEYARIAQNLRNGVGYVGIVSPGPQLVFNPLFPLLISGASFLIHDYEWAGRLVSLILGGLLPLPVFGIASRLFNRRVGLIAAILVILHPLLVKWSFSVLSEGPYTTIFMSAIYVVVRALNRPSIRIWALVGGTFGIAYLVRQEAVAALLIAVLFAFAATEGRLAIRSKRASAAIGVFLVLALPEVIFNLSSDRQGEVRWKERAILCIGQADSDCWKNSQPGPLESGWTK